MALEFEPLREARIEAGLPLVAIAQAAGKSIGWVYSVERGVLRPGREEAESIASLLGTQPEDLFTSIRDRGSAA